MPGFENISMPGQRTIPWADIGGFPIRSSQTIERQDPIQRQIFERQIAHTGVPVQSALRQERRQFPGGVPGRPSRRKVLAR